MRMRLLHKLALFTSLLLAVTIVAIAGVVIRQVNSGFNSYLDERDHEQLKAFASVVADGILQGKYDAAHLGLAMPRLLDEQARRQGGAPLDRPPGPPPFPPDPQGLPLPRIETMPGAGFGGRIAILSTDGHVLAGGAFPQGDGVIEEPVVVKGTLVARVQLIKLHRASEDLDRRFLRDQVKGIAEASGLAFAVAFCGILWFSQRLVQPLRAAQLATGRISHGDFNIRLPESGADEIADLVRNINAMAGSLQKLESSRKNWLAQLSHELRTPLTVLQGGCEAMLDGVRPVSVDGIALLHERVLAIKRIVEDLHTVSLADLGSLPHVFIEMDAVASIQHVLQGELPRVQSAGISIEFEKSVTSVLVCWDEGRIRQLLENLVENSLRYTDAPGRIKVELADGGEFVTLRWEDSAPGVPSQDLERVFEPLYRADVARSRKLGGSGLGLAICRAIVSAHFGKISATASPLGGVCIHITLPKNPSRQ